MNLTEEKCRDSLSNLYHVLQGIYCDGCLHNESKHCKICNVKEDLSIMRRLVHEHFDNPPLKLEELEDGEWYWCEEYGWCLMNFYEDLDGKIHFEANTVMNDKIDLSFDFEENRFYRKQVKDDV